MESLIDKALSKIKSRDLKEQVEIKRILVVLINFIDF